MSCTSSLNSFSEGKLFTRKAAQLENEDNTKAFVAKTGWGKKSMGLFVVTRPMFFSLSGTVQLVISERIIELSH